MSFDLIESSIERGAPINLYRITTGDREADVYRYTDSENLKLFAGEIYDKIQIERGPIKTATLGNTDTLELKVPTTLPVVEVMRYTPPSFVIRLTIYQGHLEDPEEEYIVLWSGMIVNCRPDTPTASLTCQPFATTMQRNGLRRNWQYGCMHVLYGPDCKAEKKIFAAMMLSSPGGAVLTTSIPTGANATHFTAGMIEWVGSEGRREIRNIRSVASVAGKWNITVSGANFNFPETGALVSLYKGCPHTKESCSAIHNNILNYGGEPWIPLKNPVGISSPFL